MIVFILLILQHVTDGDNVIAKDNSNYLDNMKKILDDLVVGFDCSKPMNISSHSFEDLTICEDLATQIDRKKERMQILQQSNLYSVKAVSCSLKRTQKSHYCGNHDHGTPLDSNGYTYNSQKIHPWDCQKYHDHQEVVVNRIGDPHWKSRRIKLRIGEENIYQYYKRGKSYPYSDVTGSQISCEGQSKVIEGKTVFNIIEHVEDHLTLESNDLLMNEHKILDKKRNRVLNCSPEDNHCYYGSTVYVWDKLQKPKCNLYEAKSEVDGVTTKISNLKYFSSNSSRIHLKMLSKVEKCDRQIYETDFKDIFLLPLENEKAILQSLPSNEASIFKTFSIQDSFLYNKLSQYIKENIEGLASHHCKDNLVNIKQWTKLITRAKSNKLQPFSLQPTSDRFFLTIGETIYSFRCLKKLLKPISLEKNVCFLNLPVQELNTDLLPTSYVNHTKFLTPTDRILTPYPVTTPCSKYFAPKFKTTSGKYLAYTKSGVEKVVPPSSTINWGHDMDYLYKVDDIEAISFDVGKGLYDFSTIKEYEELTIFSGSEDQLISSLARSATKNGRYDAISHEDLSPENVFPTYPWKSIKQALIDKFVLFGRICSIAIALYTVASFIKTLFTTMLKCVLLKRIGG